MHNEYSKDSLGWVDFGGGEILIAISLRGVKLI